MTILTVYPAFQKRYIYFFLKDFFALVHRNKKNATRLASYEIGQAIGRSRRTVDAYIADLRATFQMDLDLKIFRMNRLRLPQERMANRLGVLQ